MSYSFPYGNPNTSTNNPIGNQHQAPYNEFSYSNPSRQAAPDQNIYQQIHQQQNAHTNFQQPPQSQYFQQVHANEPNRQPDMSYSRFAPAPFMTERPTGPAPFPRQPYFVQMPHQRMPYPGSIIVDGYSQMYQATRPIQIMPPNGQLVNQMQSQQISATPPYFDGSTYQTVPTQTPQIQQAQGPYAQPHFQQAYYGIAWNPNANPQAGGMPSQIPAQIPAQRYPQAEAAQPQQGQPQAIIQNASQPQQQQQQQPQQQVQQQQQQQIQQPLVPIQVQQAQQQAPPMQIQQPIMAQTQFLKRERKPLLIVDPETLKPFDPTSATLTVKDSVSMSHIHDNHQASTTASSSSSSSSTATTNKPAFTNSFSLNTITTNQKPVPQAPTAQPSTTAPISAATQPTSSTTSATTAPIQNNAQQETKNKQIVQNDFAINVLRRHTEMEKQKSSTTVTAQSDPKAESSNVVNNTEPDKQDESSVSTSDHSKITVNRSAATEIPKSAVAIGPSRTTPQPQASSPSTKTVVQKPSSETTFGKDKFVPIQDDSKTVKQTVKSRNNSLSPSAKIRSQAPAQIQEKEKEVEQPKQKAIVVQDDKQKDIVEICDRVKTSLEINISADEPAITPPMSTDSERMKDSNSCDESLWTPEQQEAKKRYNRDFLLSMKDKQLATTKPRDLPNIPNVIIDEPNKPQGIPRTTSMDGGYYGRGSTGRRPGMRPSGAGRGGGGHGSMQQKVIDVPSYHDVDKFIHKTENPYVLAIHDPNLKGTEKVLRQVREILNKLTPQKFQKLANDLISLDINSEERLKGVIDVIFEKAIDEPAFSQTYANLCKILSTIKVSKSSSVGGTLAFRTLLLSRCQREFETDFYKEINYDELSKNVEDEKDEVKKKELKEQLDEKLSKAKRRSLGNIRFIGELFKLQMLTEVIMNDCINRLLKQESDEENLECLCRLLTTIGKDIDKPSNSKQMKEHFDKLSKIRTKTPAIISARIKFMIMDVVELRASDWVPRRKDNAPKTIDEIHREVQEEQIRNQIEIAKLQQSDTNKRSSIGQGPKGQKMYQQQQSSGGLKSTSMDAEYSSRMKPNMANKIKDMKNMTSNANNQEISLGPPKFFKNQTVTKPAEVAPPRRDFMNPPSHYGSDYEDRRGSVTSQAYGSKTGRPYQQQTTNDIYKKDRKLENVKQMDRVQNRSEQSSRDSSRETSRSRPSDSRDNSVTRSSDVSSAVGSDQNISTVKPKRNYKDSEIELLSKDVVEEYVNNGDINEALKDFEDFNPINAEQYEDLVRSIVQYILEKSENTLTLVGKLFYCAIKEKKMQLQHFVGGMRTTFESAEDLAIDIPKMGTYLGSLLSPFVQEDESIQFFKELIEPIIGTQICVDFIVKILQNSSNRLGHNSVLKTFKKSNINVYDLLKHIENIDEFLNKKNLEYLVNTRERTQSATISSESYEAKLVDILNRPKADNEKIFDSIETEFSETDCKSKQFVRALITALLRQCISADNKIDQDLFKKRGPILSKFIARDDNLEVESLFAVQSLDFQTKHQPGLIRVIFDMLYDEDIISEDAFRTWQGLDREEGHAISVLSLKAFFDWLDEAEATDN